MGLVILGVLLVFFLPILGMILLADLSGNHKRRG
jgi:hypothetical protein